MHVYLVWVLLFLVVGGLYGFVRSVIQPASLNDLMGRPVRAEAVIDSVHPFPGGVAIDLRIVVVQTDLESRQVNASSVWFLRGQEPPCMKGGAYVLLSGVFTQPSPANNQGRSSYLVTSGPTYTFSGRAGGCTLPAKTPLVLIRDRINTAAQATLPKADKEDIQLLLSIVFGTGSLGQQVKQSFLSAGLLHVLAASGANVLLLQQALELVGSRLWRAARLPYVGWILMLLGFVWLFAGLCSFAPSIVRAAGMSTYVLVGRLIQRRATTTAGLRVTALAEAVWDPAQLASVSSILSFVATAAVANALADLKRGLSFGKRDVGRRLQSYVLQAVRVNLMVDVYLLPITMAFFEQITPYGLISNFAAEPLLTLLLPVAATFMVLSALTLSTPLLFLAQFAGQFSLDLLHLLTTLVSTVAHWPFALLHVQLPSFWWLGAYYGIVIIAKKRQKSL